jgi:hypothetical protein
VAAASGRSSEVRSSCRWSYAVCFVVHCSPRTSPTLPAASNLRLTGVGPCALGAGGRRTSRCRRMLRSAQRRAISRRAGSCKHQQPLAAQWMRCEQDGGLGSSASARRRGLRSGPRQHGRGLFGRRRAADPGSVVGWALTTGEFMLWRLRLNRRPFIHGSRLFLPGSRTTALNTLTSNMQRPPSC